MKKVLLLIVFTAYFQNMLSQNKVYLDEKGNQISQVDFLTKWRNKDNYFSRWDHINKYNFRVCELRDNLYQTKKLNYTGIKLHLEKLTNKTLPDSTTILIEYFFKDDLCSTSRDNSWDAKEIKKVKKFYSRLKKKIEKNNTILICLFEEGMSLKNEPADKDEYFFSDQNNLFRKLIFNDPTLCGSYALLKPNGETLVRNGEYRPDMMTEHLKNINWDLFFPTK